MHELLHGLLSLVAPPRCAGCDEPSGSTAAFCEVCETLLEPACRSDAVFEYGGPIADAIQRFKYEGRSELGTRLGQRMVAHAVGLRAQVDALVPVPLHWRRRRSRGYDQAALLARPLAKSLGVPVLFRGLRRVRNTPQQVGLRHQERQENLRGAFAGRGVGCFGRVLLVDDVRTTGATLDAAAAALKQAGVLEVRSLVLATRVLGQAT